MIHFNNRGQRTLPETGYGAHGELLIGCSLQNFVSAADVAFVFKRQTEFQAQALQEIARAARVARGAAADANGVVALWLEIEQGVESSDAEDARERRLRFHRNILQRLHGKVFVRV